MIPQPIDVLARTIYGEARGESLQGQVEVAWCIRNRVEQPCWWGDSYETVCLKPWQFSAWNANDPNRVRLERLTYDNTPAQRALFVALGVTLGDLPSRLDGRPTHYYAPGVIGKPAWARDARCVGQVGGHLFFDNVP